MKCAYDSAANRPAYCDPTGAASGVDGGTSPPDSELVPHSVTMIGIADGQPNIGVASAERISENIGGISASGADGVVLRASPPYQCTMARSKLGHAAASTLA